MRRILSVTESRTNVGARTGKCALCGVTEVRVSRVGSAGITSLWRILEHLRQFQSLPSTFTSHGGRPADTDPILEHRIIIIEQLFFSNKKCYYISSVYIPYLLCAISDTILTLFRIWIC